MRDLRAFLDVLDKRGELQTVATDIDPRFLSPLLGNAERGLLFTSVRGYPGHLDAGKIGRAHV